MPPQFDTTVCEATLYNYIYRGDVFLVLNPEHLHEKGRRHYGEKYGEQRNAARAAKGPRIDKRDPIINSRTTFGHWEMDSVMGTVGSSRALVVLTERLTRAGIILPVPGPYRRQRGPGAQWSGAPPGQGLLPHVSEHHGGQWL